MSRDSLIQSREPQPSDGPDYHAEHAFWRETQQAKVKCPSCPFVSGCPGQCGWKVERNG